MKPHLYVSVVDGEQSEVYFVVGSAEDSNGTSCFSAQNGSDEEEDRPEVAVDLCVSPVACISKKTPSQHILAHSK